MDDNPQTPASEEIQTWIKATLEKAVQELMRRNVVSSLLVEAKPVWSLPFTLLLGKIRERDSATGFDWFICGDCPTDVAPHTVAATPREAARHFALQWQLDAARREQGKPARQGMETLDRPEDFVKRAEALYELTVDPGFWQE